MSAYKRINELAPELLAALRLVVAGYDYNPGDSDLDDEQPIHVSMTMGDYRKIRSLVRELK